MRTLAIAAVAALAFASSGPTFAASMASLHRCPNGVPCGNSCIAVGKTCHVSTPPHCTTGIPCGNTCIAKGKVCHKP
jgi:hypothetical protein